MKVIDELDYKSVRLYRRMKPASPEERKQEGPSAT
jgi:hypothetical protein